MIKKIDCGTCKKRLGEVVLAITHNLCIKQIYEKYQNFYLKTFSFGWWNYQYIWIGVFSNGSVWMVRKETVKRSQKQWQYSYVSKLGINISIEKLNLGIARIGHNHKTKPSQDTGYLLNGTKLHDKTALQRINRIHNRRDAAKAIPSWHVQQQNG